MAIRDIGRDFLSQLQRVREEVREKFSGAHRLLQEREAALLQQLQEIELNYKDRDMRVDKQRKEVLTSKEHLQSTMKGNENLKILEAMLAPLDARLRELEMGEERLERIGLEWDVELETKLRDIGKISLDDDVPAVISDYKSKGKPVLVACKACKHTEESTPAGEFNTASSIAIDPNTENIYICDEQNHRIQVFTKACEFIFMFDEKMKNPVGIAIHDNKVYVTQANAHTLCVYTIDGQYLQSVGSKGNERLQFNSPLGISTDANRNLIFVCDWFNHRIQILNFLNLTFHSFITGLFYPRDIKVSNHEIFVLDRKNPCIHVYNEEHQLLRELISHGQTESQIFTSFHFVIDQNTNLLISDHSGCVSIFTKEGNLIHKFGKKGKDMGEFIEPKGIAIDSEGRIIVASSNPNHCIQFF